MKVTNIDPIVNMVLNPLTHEEAAVAGFRVMHQNAASFGGLDNMLSRAKALLALIDQRDKEIATLKARVRNAEQALTEVKRSRAAYAAEQIDKAQHAVENRLYETVVTMIRGPKSLSEKPPASKSGSLSLRRPKTQQTAASSKKRSSTARASLLSRRGANTEALVLSLLTNEWKTISTLFWEARALGFNGTENTIRFACVRLKIADNAAEGLDYKGRIAFRRA